MSTFNEIQTRVLRYVIDAPPSIVAEAPLLIAEAHRFIQDQHNFQWMKKSASFTTDATTHTLGAKPSDWKAARSSDRPEAVPEDEFAVGWKLNWAGEEGTISGFMSSTQTGQPKLLALSEAVNETTFTQNIQIWPLSDGLSDWDADGEYRIRVPYWAYRTCPTGSNSDWLTSNGQEYLIYKAVEIAFSINWDLAGFADAWAKKAAGQIRRLISLDKINALAGMTTLVPFWEGPNQMLTEN